MNAINRRNSLSQNLFVNLARAFVVAGFLLCAWIGLTQSTPPVLTIAPTGTNALSITVTNAVTGTGSYEVWTTPILGDTVDYPWTGAAMGTNGQTNFVLNIPPYPAGFYQVILDTNAIPLWEAADPHNPSAGILNVWIDSPANGSTLN